MEINSAKRTRPSLQFLILVALAIGIIVAGNLIGVLLVTALYGLDMALNIMRLDFSDPHTVTALWILQVVGTTLPLLITPIVFARWIVKQPSEYLKPTFRFPWQLLLIVFAVMLVSSPLMEFLVRFNQKMVLPEYLKGVQDWMRESEDRAQKLVALLLKMDTVADVFMNVIAIGLLTAIVEELMFRGCLQTIFVKWTGNIHAAVWITAILFSAFHMEFFGFLPRLLLGALFGYFAAWSGSVWPAVLGHFINNATAVIVTYLYQHKTIKINPDEQQVFNYPVYLFSLVIVLFLLYLYQNVANRRMLVA